MQGKKRTRFPGWESKNQQPTSSKIKPKGWTPNETANGIKQNILRAVNGQPGCVAYRINNVGIYDPKIGQHRKASTQRGIFDVVCIIRGICVWIEIKAAGDKASTYQSVFQQEIRLAGGVAEFVHSTDEFLELFSNVLKNGKI